VNARWLCGLLLLATTAFACKKVNPGYCDTDQDCGGVHNSCDMTTHRCPADAGTGGTGGIGGNGGKGGVGGAAGSHAGTGGKPFSCADTKCPDGMPICDMDAGACKSCETSSACKALNAMTPVCVTNISDAASSPPVGVCVGCLANTDCGGNTPVCNPATTTCVGCLTSNDCRVNSPKTPVCNQATTTCIACGSDSDCTGVGPGICMTDGHCASDGEVSVVDESVATCPGAGTSASPYCALPTAATALKSTKPVILILGGTNEQLALATTAVGPVIVGRQNSKGDPGGIPANAATAVSVTSDVVLIRDLTIDLGSSSSSKGVVVTGASTSLSLLRVTVSLGKGLGVDVESGATLTTDRCYVVNNSVGGILVNGAISKIQNTAIAAGSSTTGYGIQFNSPLAGSQFSFNAVVDYPIAASSDLNDIVPLNYSIVVGPAQNCTTDTSLTTAPPFSSKNPFHLTGHAACPKGVTTFPAHDIDGQPRTPPIDCGADQYAPLLDAGQ
jgi:hypothetical protein